MEPSSLDSRRRGLSVYHYQCTVITQAGEGEDDSISVLAILFLFYFSSTPIHSSIMKALTNHSYFYQNTLARLTRFDLLEVLVEV